MLPSSPAGLMTLLTTYGYWAVFAAIAIESTGIPFPGETMLLVASIYAGTTHQLAPVLVIASAAGGAILGDNLGFWVGRVGGSRLLHRNAHLVRLNERKLKLGLYLFRRHGGKVVFFRRFVAVLRMWAAVLAGMHRMAWLRFLLFNAMGGLIWATLYGLGGYLLGGNLQRLTGPLGLVALLLAVLSLVVLLVFVRRKRQRLEAEAERVFPGPREEYYPGTGAQCSKQVQGQTDLARPLQRHAARVSGTRRPLVSAGMMVLGVLACAVCVYLHVVIHYHERAYTVLALGLVLFLAGGVGRSRDGSASLIRWLRQPLCYGALTLLMLTTLAVLLVVPAHSHTSVFHVLAMGLQKLRTHGTEMLLALVVVGAFGLLAGVTLRLAKAMRQAPLN